MSQAAQALPALIVSSEQLSWQERALCAQTDPEAFFPEKGGSTRGLSESAFPVMFVQSVWSTPWLMMSGLEFGAVYQNVNVAA